jgi:hypothetical protein
MPTPATRPSLAWLLLAPVKASVHPADSKWYTFSVPRKNGIGSGHLTFLPSLQDDFARQIVFSLGPVPETHKGPF